MSPTFTRPVAGGFVTDDFSEHRARGSVNPGIDYAVPAGTPVVAPADGVVARADGDPGGAAGRFIGLNFDNGWGADLLHLQSLSVKQGQRVRAGQVIARSGGSAYGRELGVGAHVHWSLRPRHGSFLTNSGNVDPARYIGKAEPWEDHKAIQRRLVVWGYKLAVDGVLGPISRAAIRDFQARVGITVDGRVGPQTWAALIKDPAPAVPAPDITLPPPVVEPPVVEPPVVEQPVVEPPAVEPPVVEPPVVEPPVVEPPVVEPPAVEPPAVDPPAVDPPLQHAAAREAIIRQVWRWISGIFSGQVTVAEAAIALVRTVVPFVYSWAIVQLVAWFGWLEWLLVVPAEIQAEVQSAIVVGLGGFIYWAVRRLAQRWPHLERVLGSSKAPLYTIDPR